MIKNTEENHYIVAQAVVDAMDVHEIRRELVWRIASEYGNDSTPDDPSPHFVEDYKRLQKK